MEFIATENTTAPVGMGFFYGEESKPTQWFHGSIAGGPCGPIFTKNALSDQDLDRLFEMCSDALGLNPQPTAHSR